MTEQNAMISMAQQSSSSTFLMKNTAINDTKALNRPGTDKMVTEDGKLYNT